MNKGDDIFFKVMLLTYTIKKIYSHVKETVLEKNILASCWPSDTMH